MIRHCTKWDLGWLHRLTEKFNAELYDRPLNHDKTKSVLKQVITDGIALRTDQSAIIGVYMDDPFRDDKFLVEIGWYAQDGWGIPLLEEFEKCGHEAGVNEVRMTTLEANARAGVLLKRRGYKPLEHSWRLQLRS